MSNKITFSKPGEAKLTWKATYNGQDVTSEIESVSVIINNEKIQLDPSASEYTFGVDETTTVYAAAEWNGMSAKSSKLVAEYEKEAAASYFGSLIIEPNTNDHTWTDAELKELFQEYYESLDAESLVDSNPLSINGVQVANPNKLLKSITIVPNNNLYDFVCAEFVNEPRIDQSRPAVIYPAHYGATIQIIDSMGNNCINDFIKNEFVMNGEQYFAYTLKPTNSLATDDGVTLPYTFKK